MAHDDDLPVFRPRFGRARTGSAGSASNKSFRNAVLAAARRMAPGSGGARVPRSPNAARSRVALPLPSAQNRRVVVKAHFGVAVAGDYGPEGGRSFDVIGSAVNLAATIDVPADFDPTGAGPAGFSAPARPAGADAESSLPPCAAGRTRSRDDRRLRGGSPGISLPGKCHAQARAL